MATEKTKFWSRWIITAVVFGVLGTIGSFMFAKVTAMPETYPTKTEFSERITEVKDDASEDRDRIRKDLKDAVDRIATEQRGVVEVVNELNRYLRDRDD